MNGSDDASSCSSGSEFMSPFAPLRYTFPSTRKRPSTIADGADEHQNDSSLFDAGLSPTSLDDDEGFRATAPYRKALSDSMNTSMATERTALLGNRQLDRLLNRTDDDESTKTKSKKKLSFGSAVCILSGVHLAMMGLHDVYVRYISWRRGVYNESTRYLAWRLPWLSPSGGTLTRFGALVPSKVIYGSQPWRMLTSLLMSTSVIEYLLIVCAWQVFQQRSKQQQNTATWTGLCCLLSAWTGQLWTLSWGNVQSISGSLSWGTCGVLLAGGADEHAARQRFLLLLVSVGLVVVSFIEPTNSIMGSIGSSLLGLVFYGAGWTREQQQHETSYREKHKPLSARVKLMSGVALLVLWVLPLLWLAAAPDSKYYQ